MGVYGDDEREFGGWNQEMTHHSTMPSVHADGPNRDTDMGSVECVPPPPMAPTRVKCDDDLVNHPAHYTTGSIECIAFIADQGFGYHAGNAVKYLTRYRHKGQPERDLDKARWYINALHELCADGRFVPFDSHSTRDIDPIAYIEDQGFNYHVGRAVELLCSSLENEDDPLGDIAWARQHVERELARYRGEL